MYSNFEFESSTEWKSFHLASATCYCWLLPIFVFWRVTWHLFLLCHRKLNCVDDGRGPKHRFVVEELEQAKLSMYTDDDDKMCDETKWFIAVAITVREEKTLPFRSHRNDELLLRSLMYLCLSSANSANIMYKIKWLIKDIHVNDFEHEVKRKREAKKEKRQCQRAIARNVCEEILTETGKPNRINSFWTVISWPFE